MGTVEFNQIGSPPLGIVGAGESVTMTFLVDSDTWVDSSSFPTRGYVIDPSSFLLRFDSTGIGLQSPFPAGQTPYFVIRNDDPAVDGFLVSTSINNPIGVPLAQPGIFGQFIDNFYVTYLGTTLSSLGILDALGTYGFGGLTVFNWTIDDGPFNAMGIVFDELSIELAGGGFTDLGGGLAGVTGIPQLAGSGDLSTGSAGSLFLGAAAPSSLAGLFVSLSSTPTPFKGGVFVPVPVVFELILATDGAGDIPLAWGSWPGGLSGATLYFQYAIVDAAAVLDVSLSNALRGDVP
jgi:hypothetical protein